MAVREGVLKHPPLFYVVASIRFQPWMMLPSKIPELQDLLRERFPVFNQLAIAFQSMQAFAEVPAASSLPPSGKPSMWAFHTNDRRVGCQVSADQIVIHTLDYERFAGFSDHVRFTLQAYLSLAKRLDVNVIGMRYLDHVSPKVGEDLNQYVPREFLPFCDTEGAYPLLGGHSQSSYQTEDGVLQARFWTGQGMLGVPDDLVPLYMLTQDLSQGQPLLFEPLKGGDGILDTDSIWQSSNPQQMSVEDVVGKLERLHAHSSGFFRKVCKDRAFEVWQGGSE